MHAANQSAQTTREIPVEEALARQEKAIAELARDVAHLEGRFNSVLAPLPAPPGNKDPAPGPEGLVRARVSDRIRANCTLIERINGHVQAIIDRSEV